MNEINDYIHDNLVELCREIVEWGDTCILRDGKLRQLEQMIEKTTPLEDGLQVAYAFVESAAVKRVSEL